MGDKCSNCGKECIKHAKGMCTTCYKKIHWKPKEKECKRCKRVMPIHAKDLCAGCYQFTFHLQRNKAWTQMRNYGLKMEDYNRITSKCKICDFDKVVDLHHLDSNHKNNSEDNLIGLCPNHHKMLHDFRYRQEMINILREKGHNIPDDPRLEFRTL
ncbi:hypothetical protein J4205_01520 [Candidatus Pacearchaeota archaeon]|nr:hypothetical protein [Candidatus Pacearchaeota archaeon]